MTKAYNEAIVGPRHGGHKSSWGESEKKKLLFKYVYERRQTNTTERVAGFLEVSSWLRYVYFPNSVQHNKQLSVQFQKYTRMKITDILLSNCLVTNTEQHNMHTAVILLLLLPIALRPFQFALAFPYN
jgi:hypothetical protein